MLPVYDSHQFYRTQHNKMQLGQLPGTEHVHWCLALNKCMVSFLGGGSDYSGKGHSVLKLESKSSNCTFYWTEHFIMINFILFKFYS